MEKFRSILTARFVTGSTVRIVGVAFLCLLVQSCGQGGPAPGPAQGAMERLDRLHQSLDRLVELLSQDDSSPSGNAEIQRELETLQEFAGGSGPGGAQPFQTKLQRVVSILSESDGGTVSPEEKNDVKAEILAIREMLDAGVDIDSISMSAEGSPGPRGAGPGAPGPGPSPPPGPGAGGPGPGPPMGSAAPDTSAIQMEMERKKRNAEETVWRARASATRMAVEQTRAAYDQSKTLHPGPGMSPQQVDQAQAAAKAANDAAVKAQNELREEARRAGVPPGWLR